MMMINRFAFCLLLFNMTAMAFNVDRNTYSFNDENDADELEGESDHTDAFPANPEYRSGRFEGDIVLSEDEDGTMEGLAREAISRNMRWENGQVPYVIDQVFDRQQLSILKGAMDDFHAKTCVRFREKTAQDTHWIRIVKDDGCYSMIGRQPRSGGQMLSLASQCFWNNGGTVRHELMHAIGFYHEQARTDRDRYIKIVWENVQDGLRNQFDKSNKNEVTDLGTEYDFDSIMHYDRTAFARYRSRPTIIALNGRTNFGQRDGFSRTDLYEINKFYDCSEQTQTPKPTRPRGSKPDTETGSFEDQCDNVDAQKKIFLNGRCYVASDEAVVFSDAVDRCNQLPNAYGHLAFTTNRNIVNELYKMVLGDEQTLTRAYYVGAYQTTRSRAAKSGWQWVTGRNRPGAKISPTSDIWRPSEPDDRNGHDERAAAIASPGGLDDVPDHARFYYICEYYER